MDTLLARLSPSQEHRDQVDRIINEYHGRPGALLSILEKVQEQTPYKYLSPEILQYISDKTGIPPAQIYSAVTFYAAFNLEPQGENTVCICRGTACHTRGSRNLLNRLKLEFGLSDETEEDEADKLSLTTADRKYSLRTVACFGQCALAPVVEVNHSVYGHMNEQTLKREIEALGLESKK